ncbi:hypothetical protein KPHVMX_400102 [Klebsiella pneumoniae]|nr:hypothetical protein KPHVMX_400102 [Klebsiella pneumoniae]SBN22663.1 hypothetical protein KPMX200_170321 [Klebsiella pneumoniae]
MPLLPHSHSLPTSAPQLIITANHFHPNPALFCLSQTRYTGAVAARRYQPKQESHNDPRTQTLFFHYHPG